MLYFVAYLAMGGLWTYFRWQKIKDSVDKNPQFIRYRETEPMKWRAVRNATLTIGVAINVLLWPVVMIGDAFWRDDK